MVMEFVESVEELFLRALFVTEHLDVVDQEDASGAIAMAELSHAFQTDSSYDFIGEPFAGRVDDFQLTLHHQAAAYSVHEMCLAHADAAVYEERVVTTRRVQSDRSRGCRSELVG